MNIDDRDLLFRAASILLQKCLEYCAELGAAYMATQWGFECWCSPDGGLDYNRHYEIHGEDAVCDFPCMGDEVRINVLAFTVVAVFYRISCLLSCSIVKGLICSDAESCARNPGHAKPSRV